jgi:anti-sigma regulatory factor (Ser/Thr protein kinase)
MALREPNDGRVAASPRPGEIDGSSMDGSSTSAGGGTSKVAGGVTSTVAQERDGASVSDDFDVVGFHEYLPTTDEIVSARHFVHETLAASGVQPDVIAAAEMVVEEFAVNAVRHTGTFFSVSVEEALGAVRIAVRDDSNVFPEVREHVVLSIGGRGLSIVASTAEEWGAESLGRGKEVWAVLR